MYWDSRRADVGSSNDLRLTETGSRDLNVLLEFSRAANAAETVDAVVLEIANAVRAGFGFDRVRVYLSDPADSTLFHGAIGTNDHGVDEPIPRVTRTTVDDPRWSSLLDRTAEVLITDDAAQNLGLRLADGRPVHHHVVVPFLTPQRLLGAVAVDNAFTDRPIAEDQVRTLLALGRQAAVALQNVQLIEEIRRSEERLRSFVTSLTETFYSGWVSRDSIKPTYFSPQLEALTGYGPDEALAIADFWRDIIHPDDRMKVMRAIEEILKGASGSLEYRIRHRNGETRWVLDTAAPASPPGPCVLVNGSRLDITERKDLEDRLRRAQRMETVGTLAGGVAHNFNNYLQIVILQVAAAQSDLEEVHPAREPLEKAQQTLNRAADLAKQLTAFGRKQEGTRVEVRLDDVVAQSVSLIKPSLGQGISLIHQRDEDAAPVLADPGHIQQALINLCMNARDAMEGTGTITVRAQNVVVRDTDRRRPPGNPPGEYVRLQVHDTGAGMDADTREHVFEPFFTTKPQGRGTGLGLAVTYTIVEDHGGWIDVDSELGRGTVFSIYLPALDTARLPAPAPAAAPMQRMVLVVDPEEGERERLARLLESLNVDVLTAEGASDAMAVMWDAGERLDAVVCSLQLGEVDLVQLARHLRSSAPQTTFAVTGDRQEIRGLARAEDIRSARVVERPYVSESVMSALGLGQPEPARVHHAAKKTSKRKHRSRHGG
jgi:PAS domain S-box-containing protein